MTEMQPSPQVLTIVMTALAVIAFFALRTWRDNQ
jgi:hypothetical protein